MTIQTNQTIQAQDLAQALEGSEGTFLCQNAGQSYFVVARRGHSIVNGPTPVGYPAPVQQLGAQPWSITKVSNQEISLGQAGEQSQYRDQQGQQRREVNQ